MYYLFKNFILKINFHIIWLILEVKFFFPFFRQSSIGRHCCLCCKIPKDEMKIARNSRGESEKRTLDSLKEDFESFSLSGGDIKNAKHYNNVIAKYLFDIPLDQVIKYEESFYNLISGSVIQSAWMFSMANQCKCVFTSNLNFVNCKNFSSEIEDCYTWCHPPPPPAPPFVKGEGFWLLPS